MFCSTLNDLLKSIVKIDECETRFYYLHIAGRKYKNNY